MQSITKDDWISRAIGTEITRAARSMRFGRTYDPTPERPTMPRVSVTHRASDGRKPADRRYRTYNGPKKAAARYDQPEMASVASVVGCSKRYERKGIPFFYTNRARQGRGRPLAGGKVQKRCRPRALTR